MSDSNGEVVLLPDDVRIVRHGEIAQMADNGLGSREIARRTGISQPTISRALRHLGYRQRYVKEEQ